MRVSVALCTHNGMAYLPAFLESVNEQIRAVDEIVILDDRSEDGTWEFLQQWSMDGIPQMMIRQNERRLGAKLNFQEALSQCTGDVILLADQDDVWLPEKVSVILQYFCEHPEAKVLFTNAQLVDDQGTPKARTIWDSFGFLDSGCKPEQKESFFIYQLLNPSLVTGATMAIRKEALGFLIPFFTPRHYWHDYWIGLVAAGRQELHAINQTLMRYRQHSSQQTMAELHHRQLYPIYRLAWQGQIADHDYEESLMQHFAHAFTRLEEFRPALQGRGISAGTLKTASVEIKRRLDLSKNKVLKRYPVAIRKWKMLKSWLKGGEYMRITLIDLLTI